MSLSATIIELFQIATHNMNWGASPPTEKSIARIYDRLGVRIPDTYQQIASSCPNYGAYLNGIGEDYGHDVHILMLNQVFHNLDKDSPPLPAHFVLISHGHDGDCDCWDVRETTSSGEHPIVHVSLEEATEDTPAIARETDIRFENFEAYFEHITLYYSQNISYPGSDPALVERAAELTQKILAKTQ